jgi:hypothetical protein
VATDGIDLSKEGTDWTADEVAVLVGSYFLMLAEERAGRDYNKSEYRRGVIAAIGRKLPASGAIFDLSGPFDKEDIEREVIEALLRQDRFKPIKIGGLPHNVVGIAYYGWQTSRLLTRHFFPEWTLGVCVLINQGRLVLAHDTEGIVFEADRLGLSRIAPEVLARGMPKSTDARAVRLSRIFFDKAGDLDKHSERIKG